MDPSYYDAQKNLFKLSPSSLPTTFQLADGTAANPSLKFILDPDLGLYRPSNNTLGITTGGVERARISDTGLQSAYDIQGLTFKFNADNTNYLDYDSGGNRIRHIINGISKFSVSDTLTGSINPIHIPAGTLSDLALAFITDPDTGLYVPGANQLGFAAGGSNALTLSSSLALFASEARADKFSFSDSITSYLEFENVGLSIDLYNASNLKLRIASAYSEHYNVFRNALGTVANTAYSFIGDGGTGLYSSAIYNIDAACNSTRVLNLSSTGIKTINGSIGLPSYSFLGDTDTGLYSIGTNIMGIACGGVLVAYAGPVDFIVQNRFFIDGFGTNVNPAMSWATDTNTGFYRSSADNFDITAGGTRSLNINASGIFVGAGGSAAAPSLSWISDTNTGFYNTADVINASCGGVQSLSILGTSCRFLDGSAGTPSISFLSDTDTGIYRSENNAVAVASAGALVFACYQTNIKPFVIVQNVDGSAALPSYSFASNNNTGIYRSAANTLTISTNGTGKVSINTANLISDIPIIGPAGSTSAPSYTFNSDTNTGLYSYGADQIGIACGGTAVGRFFNAGFIMNGNIFTNLTPSGGTLHWYLRTNGSVLRNAIGMSATESGSDTGSNLAFWNYTDAGGFKAQIYENERSTNNNYYWGRLWVGQTSSTTIPSIGFLNQTSCGLSSYYSQQIEFITNSVHRFSMTNNSILPAADAAYNLGSAGLRMNTIYASVGAINTSDRTLKDEIEPCQLGLEFVNKLKPVKYKWKNRSYEEKYYDEETKEEKTRIVEKVHTRFHMGLIAQDVRETLDELEISTNDFAGYVDSSINEPGINTLGLNYTQFVAPMIKAIQEMSQKINELSSRIGEDN